MDLATGTGLTGPLTGCTEIIDVSNIVTVRKKTAIEFFASATRNLLEAGASAGTRHVITLSIVGIDDVGLGYYLGKRTQEEAVRLGPLPWSILRATQFHEFAEPLLDGARGPFVVVPHLLCQPVAVAEVARAGRPGGPAAGRSPATAGRTRTTPADRHGPPSGESATVPRDRGAAAHTGRGRRGDDRRRSAPPGRVRPWRTNLHRVPARGRTGGRCDIHPKAHERNPMNNLAIRLTLAIPFLEEVLVGCWNQFAPHSFYDNFPTVNLNPPFSHHFAHDFGGATMGIALVLGIAMVTPRTHYVVPAALAFSTWAVPHFFYHLLNTFPPTLALTITLHTANAVVAVLGLTAVGMAVLRDRRATSSAM
ncbi:SDR family oxidoreductase [Pseudonocardia spinosispora]|uniref:SDR family oxidoreductase n=1 Tax=Pseudonocardia spinosispora TaxID=103441 RepID=UPI001B7FBA43|nr:hypothetical protein [Pseudonocardia spinosispora]